MRALYEIKKNSYTFWMVKETRHPNLNHDPNTNPNLNPNTNPNPNPSPSPNSNPNSSFLNLEP
jgi:hypothetical protein